MVDGAYVSPGMVLDGAQRPHPADMRVGFFDFAPLPSLSPFAGLTAYSGAPVAEVAEVLRASPFVGATAASLELAQSLAAEYAGDDPEKADFVTLVGRVRTLVGP